MVDLRRSLVYGLIGAVLVLATLLTIWYGYVYASGSSVVVRFAVELNDHSSAFWVALDKGWFEEEGIHLDYKVFSTGLELAAALTRGDVDVALACVGPLLLAKDRGVPLKLVAMMHNHGYAIVVNPDKVRDISDLNGKSVSAPGPGSPAWLLLMLVKDKYNLSMRIHRMPPFMATTALLTGKIDVASIPEHYATLAESMGAKVLLRSQDIWPTMPGSGVGVTEDFLRNHRDLVVKIVKVLARAVDYIKEHPDEAAKIVAKHLASDVGIMKRSMSYLEYTIKVNVHEIQHYINYLVEYNILKKNMSALDFVDTSILRELGFED